jgi:hypothetical protein
VAAEPLPVEEAARLRRREARRQRSACADAESTFREFVRGYYASAGSKPLYVLTHPVKSFTGLVARRRLPCLVASLSAGAEGEFIRAALRLLALPLRAAAVLMLPDSPAQFAEGRHYQTLRRKVRHAQRLGVWCGRVDDPAERQRLFELANEFERTHPNEIYRHVQPENSDLFDFRLWIAAYAEDGRPLLLSVTPVDGDWAMLRHFRIIGLGEEQSNARYLALHWLGSYLTGLGVRYLFDPAGVASLPEGLQHFQRMVGFRLCRVKLRRPAGDPATSRRPGIGR